MAQRKDSPPPQPQGTGTASTDTVESRVVAFAEQVGRLVGTAHGKADGWLDGKALNEQLTRIRDGAAELLNQLAAAADSVAGPAPRKKKKKTTTARPPARPSKQAAAGRSGGKVDAPGKKHRRPPPTTRGAKHSDETISKVKLSQTMRRSGRQG